MRWRDRLLGWLRLRPSVWWAGLGRLRLSAGQSISQRGCDDRHPAHRHFFQLSSSFALTASVHSFQPSSVIGLL